MLLNSQYSQNKATPSQPNFGLLEMKPQKIVRTFCPKGGAEAEKLTQEIAIAKLVLEARTNYIHAIFRPAIDINGAPIIKIKIQELTPKCRKTNNPIKALVNWALRKIKIKYKKPHASGYTYFLEPDKFASKVIDSTERFKKEFYDAKLKRTYSTN